jgi:hypothetical protein
METSFINSCPWSEPLHSSWVAMVENQGKRDLQRHLDTLWESTDDQTFALHWSTNKMRNLFLVLGVAIVAASSVSPTFASDPFGSGSATPAPLLEVHHPCILHIATHGFFAPIDSQIEPSGTLQIKENRTTYFENPMHRSGLDWS